MQATLSIEKGGDESVGENDGEELDCASCVSQYRVEEPAYIMLGSGVGLRSGLRLGEEIVQAYIESQSHER